MIRILIFATLFLLTGCGENVAGKASRERQDTAIRETDNDGFAAERRLQAIEEKMK